MKKHWVLSVLVIGVMLLAVGSIISCGSKSNDSSSTTTSQAASSSSSAKGAVSLSDTVGMSADIAKDTIPATYAPGKTGSSVNTEDIAGIDPRMKDVVDKMVLMLQKTGAKTTASKAALSKSVSSAPSVTVTATGQPCAAGGTFDVTYTLATAGTETTWNLSMTFTDCRDASLDHDLVNGTITAVHTKNSSSSDYEHAHVVANLTDTVFDDPVTMATGTFIMNGTFDSIATNNHTIGTRSALGSFTWRIPSAGGETSMVFSFGSGSTPVTDVWSKTTDGTGTTVTRTGNGSYNLAITTPSSALALAVSLSSLKHDLLIYSADGSTDEWINGAVTIAWTPDLSQWGCLAGTYTFTTALNTPVHTPFLGVCPTAGTVAVNNATIEYGKPSGVQVTVTVGGLSETFASCGALGKGLCR